MVTESQKDNLYGGIKGVCMNYLIVVAHSGDEILGCGGTIQKLIKSGAGVSVCVLDGKKSYGERKEEDTLPDHRMVLSSIGLKIENLWTLDTKKETVAFSSLVSFIEKCMVDNDIDSIITYHPAVGDRERREAARATQKASQLYKRNRDLRPLVALMYMEFPSATDVTLDPTVRWFSPNFYVTLSKDMLEKKEKAITLMNRKDTVTSAETIRGVAAMRGAQSGSLYSEAFESVYIRV